jgi:hypothetical protein
VSADDPGWYFAGRRDLTTTVAEFLRTGIGLFLVTGAGKVGHHRSRSHPQRPGVRAGPALPRRAGHRTAGYRASRGRSTLILSSAASPRAAGTHRVVT